MNRIILEHDGSKISIKTMGPDDGIPLLLVTGFIGEAIFWDPFIAALPKGYRVISFDQRGSGESGAYTCPLSMEQLARDALAVAAAVEHRPVHLIGHSMGACAGWVMADLAPERLASASLIAGWHAADAWMKRVFNARLAAFQGLGPLAYGELTTLFMTPPTDVSMADGLISSAEKSLIPRLPPYTELVERTEAVMSFRADDWDPSTSVPTSIVCAADDWMTPIALSHHLHDRLPNASFIEVLTGGHYLPRTRSIELADRITTWVNHIGQ